MLQVQGVEAGVEASSVEAIAAVEASLTPVAHRVTPLSPHRRRGVEAGVEAGFLLLL